MKRSALLLVLILSGLPAFAQDFDDFEPRIGAVFAQGHLALRDLKDRSDPVQQLKRFFADAKMPLTSAQERQMNSIIDTQEKAVRNSRTEESTRRINEEYTGKFYGVLTAEQRLTLRRYRTDEIMLRSGFASLKEILDGAQKPLTPAQEQQARMLYERLQEDVRKLPQDAKGAPDRLQLDKAEADALAAVLKLLTAEQRQVLVNSRQASVNRIPR